MTFGPMTPDSLQLENLNFSNKINVAEPNSLLILQIAPAWFDDQWKDGMKENVSDNWRLKVSNLRKVKSTILDYYQVSLSLN